MTGWYDFSNVKSSKMLSFYSVAEAYGLIYPRPSGENFSFVCLPHLARSKSYHSANATKGKFLVFKGVSNNVTLNDFKDLLLYNKITNAEAERMKSKRSGRDQPFIKITLDNLKQSEALISGGLECQKAGIIFRVEEFRTTPSIQQCFKCQGFGHKAPNCTKKPKCVVCGEAHSHKNCPNKEKRSPKCADCRGPHVAIYKGCPAYRGSSL